MFELLNKPFSNGFLLFTLGVLFMLSLYHALLYFQHKEKLYLLYSAYTFFIILAHIHFVTEGFLNTLFKPIAFIKNFPTFYTEMYYLIYIVFAFKFLNVKQEYPKFSNVIKKWIYILSGYSLIKLLFFLYTDNRTLDLNGYYIYVFCITVISIASYIVFFKLNNKLKYYIIVGGILLSLCSYISLAYYLYLGSENKSPEPAYTILYIGFILENILFALGLGQKQKIILQERNESQTKLIEQLKENERLSLKAEQQLKKNVVELTEQAEIEKLTTIKIHYEKEMAELKVSALRSQMNPHFIFNSLNSIKRYIIDSEKENAVYYLNKFSKLIRKILSASMEKEISLAEEIETAELYVNIENIRFDNSIEFQLHIDKDLNLDTIKIPSLILQPFIENAIWHGLSLKKNNKQLSIEIAKLKKGILKIDISDNGIGRKRSGEIKDRKIHKRNSLGIKLTKERLHNFVKNFSNDFDIIFNDLVDDDGTSMGTRVTIILPIK